MRAWPGFYVWDVMRVCDFDGCDRKHYGKGWCVAHLSQFKRGQDMQPIGVRQRGSTKGFPRFCRVDNCEYDAVSKSLCRMHYNRERKGNDLSEPEIGGEGYWHECEIAWCDKPASFKFPICQRHRRVARQYGMTPSGYLSFCTPAECKACGGDNQLSVHHDHGCCPGQGSCGKCVVALLCFACNLCAGVVGDDPEKLRRLADVIDLKSANRNSAHSGNP